MSFDVCLCSSNSSNSNSSGGGGAIVGRTLISIDELKMRRKGDRVGGA